MRDGAFQLCSDELRTWLLNSASAYQAVAHLLCELHARADNVGLVADGRCRIPLTQQDIGDAVGITSVHTNRVLQKLRNAIGDRKSTRLNSSHCLVSRMPSSA